MIVMMMTMIVMMIVMIVMMMTMIVMTMMMIVMMMVMMTPPLPPARGSNPSSSICLRDPISEQLA